MPWPPCGAAQSIPKPGARRTSEGFVLHQADLCPASRGPYPRQGEIQMGVDVRGAGEQVTADSQSRFRMLRGREGWSSALSCGVVTEFFCMFFP